MDFFCLVHTALKQCVVMLQKDAFLLAEAKSGFSLAVKHVNIVFYGTHCTDSTV